MDLINLIQYTLVAGRRVGNLSTNCTALEAVTNYDPKKLGP